MIPIKEIMACAYWSATYGNGLPRYQANVVLQWLNLPQVPMLASREEAENIYKNIDPDSVEIKLIECLKTFH